MEIAKEPVNIVFIGHVDSGKSNLCGHLLYLMGQVDERTIEKLRKEAEANGRATWVWSYIMDTIDEERQKGKTVEVGTAMFESSKKRYTILDAPGHKNLIPNMLIGTTLADIAILVISAKTGEFEAGFERGGQTREHGLLAKTVGARHLVVVVNKMDEVQWNLDRYQEIVTKVGTFLKKECMFSDVAFIPISAFHGDNLVAAKHRKLDWYKEPIPGASTLVQHLDALPPIPRILDGPMRMPIVSRYKDMGTVSVFGKIESGRITGVHPNNQVILMPQQKSVTVSSILDINDEKKPIAQAGEYIRLILDGPDEILQSIQSGDTLISTPAPLVTKFTAQVMILDLPPTMPILTIGYDAMLHLHVNIKECTVIELIEELDPKTRKVKKTHPTFLRSQNSAVIRFSLSSPMLMETFAQCPILGRFSLRDKGRTIAVGKVISVN